MTQALRRSLLAMLSLAVVQACGPSATSESGGAVPLAEGAETITVADYERAQSFLGVNTADLVSGNILAQYWQDSDRLIYRRSTGSGSETVLADVQTRQKSPLFDNARLASALADYADDVDADDLSLSRIKLSESSGQLDFDYAGRSYTLELAETPPNEYLSPDGSKAAFIDEHNLWVRDTASNALTQLTFDGEQDYGYATNNAGWLRDDGPVLLWSPDSAKIATFRHDGRNVKEMYLWSTQVGHGDLDAWKYPLPGDDYIFMIERIVIHLEQEPRIVRLNMPPDPHRSTTSDHIAGRGGVFLDVEWSEDGETLSFVSSSRDHKIAQLQIANPQTGAVRAVHREEVATYYESGYNSENWRVFPQRNEFIWFSEQDNWGHLYLHDLQTGALKRRITEGNWAVLQIDLLPRLESREWRSVFSISLSRQLRWLAAGEPDTRDCKSSNSLVRFG